MNFFEIFWVVNALILIIIVLLIDPKSSMSGASSNPMVSIFSSPSGGQNFIYRASALLIVLFYGLTILLSYNN